MLSKEEIFMDVPGYDGIYKASTEGKIVAYAKTWDSGRWIKRSHPEMEINQISDARGYKVVNMRKNGLQRMQKVHRIIALTFLPNPENRPQVNHKNGVRWDNRLINLEWATSSENLFHAYYTGLKVSPKGVKHGACKLTEMQVIQIRNSKVVQHKLAEQYGVSRYAIWRIKSGKGWKHLPTISKQ